MYKFQIKIADLLISIESKHEHVYKKCSNYLDLSNKETNIKVTLSDLNLESFNRINDSSPGFIESLAIYDAISSKLPNYQAFMMHGAAIGYENRAYIFVAPPETGKSTHIALWKSFIKDLVIINGDKPIIRLIDNKPIVYGSPWNGKENLGSNSKCPLKAVILLKRGKNSIKKIDKKDCLNEIIKEIYMPNINILEEAELINNMFKDIDFYELSCEKNKEAFYVAYKGLVEKEYENY